MIKVKDLNMGLRVVEPYLIRNVTNGVSNNGSPYLTLELMDNTGTIEAKIWDASQYDIDNLTQGKIVRITADVQEYRDRLQLKVVKYDLLKADDYNLDEFVQSSPVPREELERRLDEVLASFTNEDVKKIIDYIFAKAKDAFMASPAATKNHHEYLGGLVEHTLSMVTIGEFLAKHYENVDRDILIAGILLHDIGKTKELSGPLITHYTTEGKLLGHISIASAAILNAGKELNITSEVPVLLAHMVLSHHGKLEFGSPVVPMTKEAFLLSMIDNLDSKMKIIDKTLAVTEPGEFTDRIWALDNTTFYNPED
jgi:3'-5' exoribonuclease